MVVTGKASAGYRLGAAVVGGLIFGIPGFPALAQTSPVQTAQAGPATRSYSFDLPAQPLTAALTAFSRITGLQTVTTGTSLEGKRASAVRGNLTADEALRQLLSGSSIMHRRVDANTITLLDTPQGSMGGVVLDALTVSGEKTERTLQETATSVAVFDRAALEDRPYMPSSNSLIERVPNVVATPGNNFAPTVRGIDGTGPTNGGYAFVAGIRPRLNLQIDGRPTTFNELVYGDSSLWDVEQVELLRGPQSTMQGRNAIAGAVVVRTKDPTWDWESGGRAMIGNEQQRQIAAYVSGPIVDDQLAFRLAAEHRTGQSYINFTPYKDVSDPGEIEATVLRGKLLFEPRQWDGFSTLLTVNYSETLQPQGQQVKWPEAGLKPAYAQMPTFEPRALSGIAETKYIMSDALTLENTFSYTDIGVTRMAPPGEGYVRIDGYEMLEEPRVRFAAMDGRLKGLAGLHAFHASQDELFVYNFFGGNNTFKDLTTTYATFGEGTYQLRPDVDITLGGRLERENRRRQRFAGGVTPVNLDETYEVFLPKLGAAWHIEKDWTVGTMVSRGYNGGGAGITFFAPIRSYTFRPEYVWNYEAYTRVDLMGGRLNLTGNAFYADYKSMQVPYTPAGSNDAIVVNAPKAHTMGAEIGARYLVMQGLTVFGTLGLLKTEIDEFTGFAGNDLPKSPALTADLGFTYKFGGGFDVGADARYSETYYSDITNNRRGKVPAYWVANAQAGYEFGSARVFGFVRNVMDSRDAVQIYTSDSSADILHPRTFGIGVDVKF